jgi:hypothetical protein
MSTISEAADKLEEFYKQWSFDSGQAGFLMPKARFADSTSRNYNLKNGSIRKFLQYEKQTLGINLGFTVNAEPATAKKVTRWFAARNGDLSQPVRFGETVAIGYGTEPSFVYYKTRDFGINLDWSKGAKYEWKILGGKVGQPVDQRKYWALYNTVAKEPRLYFDRSGPTGDIGWPSSKTWGQQLKELGIELAEKAAQEAAKAAVQALLAA